jgi:hypothetical protein
MTSEDKKIVADYMNWHYVEHEGIYYYDWDGRRQRNLDLNDAGLVVEEMQERYEWDEFMHYCWKYFPLGKDYIGRLFNADNFFNAFVQWRKTK